MAENDRKKEMSAWVKSMNKEYDHGGDRPFIITVAGNEEVLKPKFMSTGILELDDSLCGGWPKGHTSMISGIYGCGKTAVCLSTAAEVIKQGGSVLYIAAEGDFSTVLAKMVGIPEDVTEDQLLVLRPQGVGEEIVNTVEDALYDKKTKKLRKWFDLIIWDSINSVVTKAEQDAFDKDGAEKAAQMASKASMYTKMMDRVIGKDLLGSGTVLLLIAQVRANMNAMGHGSPHKIASPYAPLFGAKVVVEMTKKFTYGKKVTGKPTPKIGHDVGYSITKNNVTCQLGEGSYSVLYGIGLDDSGSVFQKLKDWGYLLQGKDFGLSRGQMIVPTRLGDVLFDKVDVLRNRIKVDQDFKALCKELLDLPKPKEGTVTLKGFKYELPSLDTEEGEEETEE